IPDPSLTFAIAATELFVATILCGRAFKFPSSVSMAGGWLLTLWTWPLFVFPKIVTLWFFSPTYAEFLSLSIIMVTAALFIGWGHTWQSIILTAIVLAGITHSLVSSPPFLVLVAPLMITSAMISFLLARSRAQRLNILLWWITLAAVCLILGYVHSLYGLLAYTSSVVFPASRVRQPDLFGGDITLLLWTPIPLFDSVHIFTPERILVGGGIIGSIVLSLVGSPGQQRFAFSVLTAEGIVLCLGFTNYWWPYWPGPQFVYFEYMLLPYFALCLCFLFFSPLLLAWRALRTRLSPTATGRALGLDRMVALLIPLGQALYAADKGPEVREQAPRYGGYALASQYPQPETPITRILKSEARLTLNEPYRGRVAVMMGRFLGEKDTWLALVLHYYSQLATGQLHDGPGLWQDDIPTLHEYSRSMTPWRWMFTRFFFGVSQWNVDIPKLAAIGVRFIITDLPLSGPKLRAQLSIEAPPSAHALLTPSEGSRFDSFQLYLYEIENVNVGQFSPVEIRRAEDAASILAALSDPLFDFRTSVIGDVPASGSLSKANLESLKMVRDGYKI